MRCLPDGKVELRMIWRGRAVISNGRDECIDFAVSVDRTGNSEQFTLEGGLPMHGAGK